MTGFQMFLLWANAFFFFTNLAVGGPLNYAIAALNALAIITALYDFAKGEKDDTRTT